MRSATGVKTLLIVAVFTLAPGSAVAAGRPLETPPAAQPSATPTPAARPAETLFDPHRPPGRELDLSVGDGFTLAAVGDLIISRPLSQMLPHDAGFAAVDTIIRSADAAFGNFETTAFDMRGFKGYPGGAGDDWSMVALPGVPRDLKTLGFDLVGRANNHALDWGLEGMRETSRLLDEAGLVHAGAGESRVEARGARYFETGLGRVGLVSIASTFREQNSALPPHGEAPGRPGISTLRTSRTTVVTAAMMASLRSLDQALKAPGKDCYRPSREERSRPPEEIKIFDTLFRIGDRPGYHYEMNGIDLAEFLKSVRQGKQHSDLLIATIHAHETGLGCHEPGDFLPVLAHAAIDAGADVFVGHGEHRLMPIEIYKGRPIFYSLANFFWSDMVEPNPADIFESSRGLLAAAFPDPEKATDPDLNAVLNADEFPDEEVFQTVVSVCRFQAGRLAELKIYPVDLRYGERLEKSGVPRLAAPPMARTILERLQKISQPFGTTIAVEQNVGVIRPRQ
jgi:poly-gamma-glutamate capsule biosynthesis protein CapA/YwtB (metallophosphatase superfamily)